MGVLVLVLVKVAVGVTGVLVAVAVGVLVGVGVPGTTMMTVIGWLLVPKAVPVALVSRHLPVYVPAAAGDFRFTEMSSVPPGATAPEKATEFGPSSCAPLT